MIFKLQMLLSQYLILKSIPEIKSFSHKAKQHLPEMPEYQNLDQKQVYSVTFQYF